MFWKMAQPPLPPGEGGANYVRVGGTDWNTLKGGWTENRGGVTDIFKKGEGGGGGQLGQGVDAFKRGGAGTLLQTITCSPFF